MESNTLFKPLDCENTPGLPRDCGSATGHRPPPPACGGLASGSAWNFDSAMNFP